MPSKFTRDDWFSGVERCREPDFEPKIVSPSVALEVLHELIGREVRTVPFSRTEEANTVVLIPGANRRMASLPA